MKTWTMPRIGVEVFVPNEYASACEYSLTCLELETPVKESNGIKGWQQHGAPAGSHIDENPDGHEGIIKIFVDDESSFFHVPDNFYDTDDTNSYWQINSNQYGAIAANGREFPGGQIFYKNYSASYNMSQHLHPKNVS